MSRSPVGTARQAGTGGIEADVWVEAVELLVTGEDVVTAIMVRKTGYRQRFQQMAKVRERNGAYVSNWIR